MARLVALKQTQAQGSPAIPSSLKTGTRARRHSRTSLQLVTLDSKAALYDRIVEGFGNAGTIKGAARYADIAATTLRDWCRRDPALRERLQDADDCVTDDLYESAVKQALGGNTRILIFLLNARGRGLAKRPPPVPPTIADIAQQLRQIAQAQPTMARVIQDSFAQILAALV